MHSVRLGNHSHALSCEWSSSCLTIQVGCQEKALHREGGQALKQGCGLVFELLIGGGIQKTREREGVWD